MDDTQMAYAESSGVANSSNAQAVWRDVVTPGVRRSEGISARRLVLAVDLMIIVAFAAVHWDRTGIMFAVLALLALKGASVYGPRIRPRTGEDLPRIVAAVAIAFLCLFFVAPADQVLALGRAVPFFLLALLIGRSATYTAIGRARRSGRLRERVLIIGADERGVDLARLIHEHPSFGLEPVGFIDEVAVTKLPLPLLGGIDHLPLSTVLHDIDRVIVAEWDGSDRDIIPYLRACTERHVHVHVAPRLPQLGTAPAHPSLDWLWTAPLMRLPETPQRTVAWKVKRIADVTLASVALILLAPLFITLAAAIKLTSHGPVLFRQTRVTQGDREFKLLKFRSLPENDRSHGRWGTGEITPTRLGRFMRSTGLDELPQFINIAKGDMSLVGPRPEQPFFIERFAREIPGYADRHRVPAGLTGWAQVHGLRGDTSIEERAMFDNEYIEYWSLWRDVVILVRTVKSFLLGEGR
jgi:exopolysaccharide biosynthesis polyprenyl glycosylphosphotransferase